MPSIIPHYCLPFVGIHSLLFHQTSPFSSSSGLEASHEEGGRP